MVPINSQYKINYERYLKANTAYCTAKIHKHLSKMRLPFPYSVQALHGTTAVLCSMGLLNKPAAQRLGTFETEEHGLSQFLVNR